MNQVTLRALALSVLALVAGCADPFDRPDSWNFSESNRANLAAQAARWQDVGLGHGDPGADGQEAAAAVDRLRKGTVKALPSATVSDIAAQSTATAATAPVAN